MIDAVIEGSLATGEVRMDDGTLADMNELRDFMFERVYLAPVAAAAPARGHRGHPPAHGPPPRHPDDLPATLPRHRRRPRHPGRPTTWPGMTDRFALRTHERLFGTPGMSDPALVTQPPTNGTNRT